MNVAVLVRTPEDEEDVVSSIHEALDKRFHITLLNILDPLDLGLSTDKLNHYSQIKELEVESIKELQSIAHRLRSMGYETSTRVEIGPFTKVIEEEAKKDRNDMIVLIKRKTLRGHMKQEREDSALAVLSKYPGKTMIIRRTN